MPAPPELCHAFVVHSRPYRERSRLVELWTLEHGRVSAVMRQTPPPLFQPCLAAWRGKHALKTVAQCETAGQALMLEGNALFAGFYLNELLVRLLACDESHPELFALYTDTLSRLHQPHELEPMLRQFEQCLLAALGYGLNFRRDHQAQVINAQALYQYYPEHGFIATARAESAWPGHLLLKIAAADFSDAATRHAAKHILRQALAQHLGNKPLKSRELWLSVRPLPQ